MYYYGSIFKQFTGLHWEPLHHEVSGNDGIDNAGYRESIMGIHAEQSSPEWVCIPEITSDSKWFLWNTNSRGWISFRTGIHDRFYFYHNVFPMMTSQKCWKSLSKSLEITVRGRKSQLSLEKKLVLLSAARKNLNYLQYLDVKNCW